MAVSYQLIYAVMSDIDGTVERYCHTEASARDIARGRVVVTIRRPVPVVTHAERERALMLALANEPEALL